MIMTVIGAVAGRDRWPWSRSPRSAATLNLTRHDLDHKQAYEAAKAGIDDYAFHLHTDNSYWTKCTERADPERGQPAGLDRPTGAPVPGDTGATYAIELLPATGRRPTTQCNTANPRRSMLETSGPLHGHLPDPLHRLRRQTQVSIVATFKPAELPRLRLLHPARDARPGHLRLRSRRRHSKAPTNSANTTWRAGTQQHRRSPASAARTTARRSPSSAATRSTARCTPTTPSRSAATRPSAGRAADMIEVSATARLVTSESHAVELHRHPELHRHLRHQRAGLIPPPTNAELATIAEPPFTLQRPGPDLPQRHRHDRRPTASAAPDALLGPVPANGVVYVENGTCSAPTRRSTPPIRATSGCGNVYVHGNYSGQLTIAAENDIIVDGNLCRTRTASGEACSA